MSWSRRWRIDSRERLTAVLSALSRTLVEPRAPLELILRTERREKTHEQRKLWHVMMVDLAPLLGLTPAETKLLIKRLFFGVSVKIVKIADREVPIELVPSSEDLERKEYSDLIDFTIRFAAEQGFMIADRRSQ